MFSKYKGASKGFTIIEVMIVLAIAGAIMLILFLAIPAVNRNSRNTQRSDEAGRIAAAVTECLANRNGVVAQCDTIGEIEEGTLNQLSTVTFNTAPPATAVTGSNTAAEVVFGALCNAAGSAYAAGGGTRAFVVVWQAEPSINRCVGS